VKSKLFSALLSAVLAFGLWLYVITVVSPGSEQTYYNIPVTLQNENILAERGLMITSDIPAVTLKLAGNRTDLNKLDENNINILVNMAGVEAPGTHQLEYSVSYPGSVASNAVTREESSLDLIPVKIEKKITRQIPVVLEYIGSVPEGFIADKENALLDYIAIETSGPESVMSQIAKAKIQVDLEGKDETIIGEFVYDLCNEAGEPVNVELVKTNVEAVNLTVKIQRVKEITLAVTVIEGGGATQKTSSIKIDPLTIRVSGSDALLAGLDVLELGTINLSEMLRAQTLTFPILLPEGITNETGVTEAKVDVKFPDLQVKKLSISNINVINVPEGMMVDMITQVLEVTVRGPKALINSITERDVTVTVDFAGAVLGTATMRPTITISSTYAEVGAVGTYVVSATVMEYVEEVTE